jgi:hypothetical protein
MAGPQSQPGGSPQNAGAQTPAVNVAQVQADPQGALVGSGCPSDVARELVGLPGFSFGTIFQILQLFQGLDPAVVKQAWAAIKMVLDMLRGNTTPPPAGAAAAAPAAKGPQGGTPPQP